jgi:hypothetical protein
MPQPRRFAPSAAHLVDVFERVCCFDFQCAILSQGRVLLDDDHGLAFTISTFLEQSSVQPLRFPKADLFVEALGRPKPAS